jgi:hypothetical protein
LRSSFLFLVLLMVLLLRVPGAGAIQDEKTEKEIVARYNRGLKELSPDPAACGPCVGREKLEALIGPICDLLAANISDPSVLQEFHFVDSYEILFRLDRNPATGIEELVSEWRKKLTELDIKAYQVNRFFARPAARWVVREAKGLSARPTPKMLGGTIEWVEGTVNVSPDGLRCPTSGKGCEKVRYVLLKCLVRGVDDPWKARERLHAFPPNRANRRVTHYWEVLLDQETLLLRRNYRLKPLPGYEGTMENYHQLVFKDPQRIVILEENARVGKFILQTDNAAAYIRSPPYGVTVALLFTGRYAMEGFFRMMVGNKPVTEPLEVLSILRQYMMNPEMGVECAVQAGEEDYRKNQAP